MNGMLHVVDMYPTLTALAGASTARAKPLDGMDVWPTLSEGKPSPRTEVIYNVEPFRAGVRQGDWKLAASMAKPMLLEAEFRAMRERLALPPALPTEPFELNAEP